jgi:hypothetical protein
MRMRRVALAIVARIEYEMLVRGEADAVASLWSDVRPFDVGCAGR